MRAIVIVFGEDHVGIIADVCGMMAGYGVNVLDISQTVMQGYFTMTMLVDTAAATAPFAEISRALAQRGAEAGLSIRMQREDIFKAMHNI